MVIKMLQGDKVEYFVNNNQSQEIPKVSINIKKKLYPVNIEENRPKSFKKSTRFLISKTTSNTSKPPNPHHTHALVQKATQDPKKITLFFTKLSTRKFHKLFVSLKSLSLLHRYILAVPLAAFTPGNSCQSYVNKMIETQVVQDVRNTVKEFGFFEGLIKEYLRIFNEKLDIHYSGNIQSDWLTSDINYIFVPRIFEY